MYRQCTIKDIAKYLNLSIATVSRALADSPKVRASTKEKVLKAAALFDYKPNPVALNLQKKRSLIGLVVPELRTSFFLPLINGIQKVLDTEGFHLIITQSNESKEIENKNLELLFSTFVDGIIISISSEGANLERYNCILKNEIPMVFVNRAVDQIHAPKIIIDDYKYAFLATEELIYNNLKNIVHFAGPAALDIAHKRKSGFRDAMIKHHLPLTDDSIRETGLMFDNGYAEMKKLILQQKLPEGIFCFSEPLALGSLKAIKECGLKCPDDVAIVSFSETEIAQFVEPTLTGIKQPTYEMGQKAASLILETIISNKSLPDETIYIPAKVNVRESSRKTK